MRKPKLSAPQERMLHNVTACGLAGLWMWGRGDLSTARALVRRGIVKLNKEDTGRWMVRPVVYRGPIY